MYGTTPAPPPPASPQEVQHHYQLLSGPSPPPPPHPPPSPPARPPRPLSHLGRHHTKQHFECTYSPQTEFSVDQATGYTDRKAGSKEECCNLCGIKVSSVADGRVALMRAPSLLHDSTCTTTRVRSETTRASSRTCRFPCRMHLIPREPAVEHAPPILHITSHCVARTESTLHAYVSRRRAVRILSSSPHLALASSYLTSQTPR